MERLIYTTWKHFSPTYYDVEPTSITLYNPCIQCPFKFSRHIISQESVVIPPWWSHSVSLSKVADYQSYRIPLQVHTLPSQLLQLLKRPYFNMRQRWVVSELFSGSAFRSERQIGTSCFVSCAHFLSMKRSLSGSCLELTYLLLFLNDWRGRVILTHSRS